MANNGTQWHTVDLKAMLCTSKNWGAVLCIGLEEHISPNIGTALPSPRTHLNYVVIIIIIYNDNPPPPPANHLSLSNT